MYHDDGQPVLRCTLCKKPFDKESTLKRHGYYCRSRKASRANRSRSCTSCARSKLRCDNRRPACSRCTTRAIECHYLAETPKSKSLAIQHRKDAPTEWRRDSSWVPGPTSVVPEELCPSRGPVFDSALLVPDPELADLGWDSLDWDGSEIDLPDFLDAEKIDHSSSWQSVSVRHPGPPTDRWVQMQQEMPSPTISVPILRSLIPRPKLKPGEQRVANLILQTLNSYPLMMIRHNTLPPFIHPRSLSADAENEHMEPLTNCINLVHMINGGFQGSRKLFWKMVRLECEHLCEEYPKLHKWALLAGLQGLAIYIFIRLNEGETEHNNLDFLLLKTVTALAGQLNRKMIEPNRESVIRGGSLEASWNAWIFEESARRICVVFQVVNMLVQFEPAAMCNLQMDLILAPLPSKRQLWEARDGSRWRDESAREPAVQSAFGLAANGELVMVDEDQPGLHDAMQYDMSLDGSNLVRYIAKWEEWCSGMDGFGGLVMLAASLVA